MRGHQRLLHEQADDLTARVGVPVELAGVAVPVLFDRMDQDPAVASSVFVTMITDSMGFFAFLGLAADLGDGLEQRREVVRVHLPVAVHLDEHVARQLQPPAVAEHGRAADALVALRADHLDARVAAMPPSVGP